MFNANQYANQENQPGQGDRMDGTSPKAYADMKEATADLFAQYKNFVSEAYNPNSADATHSRDVNASHKADLKKKADAGDEGAKKRLAAMKDKEDTRRNDYNDRMERESVEEGKPSAGMSKGEKSSLAKKAAAGKDIGKPGKSFDKIASKAGGGEKGKKIAAAAMWKNAAKK